MLATVCPSLSFTSTVCSIDVQNASKAFNLLSFSSNGVPIFDLRGDGEAIWHSGGLTIESGGLLIQSGGAYCALSSCRSSWQCHPVILSPVACFARTHR